jgi:RHH-type proline utilization regulon transcriptional repressor/proline dehydrogenase/delta 1-pyrroline-5-carboxylate dehydrogenase
VLATGNRALFAGSAGEALVAALPAALKGHAAVRKQADAPFDAVLFEGDSDELQTLVKDVAQRPGRSCRCRACRRARSRTATRKTTRSSGC